MSSLLKLTLDRLMRARDLYRVRHQVGHVVIVVVCERRNSQRANGSRFHFMARVDKVAKMAARIPVETPF
jgi:hypothetical protein